VKGIHNSSYPVLTAVDMDRDAVAREGGEEEGEEGEREGERERENWPEEVAKALRLESLKFRAIEGERVFIIISS